MNVNDRRYWFRRRSWSIGYEPNATAGWLAVLFYIVVFECGLFTLLNIGSRWLPGMATWFAVAWGAACTVALIIVAATYCDPDS